MVSPHVFSQLILIVFLWLVVIVHLTRSKRPVTAPATPTAEPEPSHPSTTAPPRRNEYRKNQAPFHAVRPAARWYQRLGSARPPALAHAWPGRGPPRLTPAAGPRWWPPVGRRRDPMSAAGDLIFFI